MHSHIHPKMRMTWHRAQKPMCRSTNLRLRGWPNYQTTACLSRPKNRPISTNCERNFTKWHARYTCSGSRTTTFYTRPMRIWNQTIPPRHLTRNNLLYHNTERNINKSHSILSRQQWLIFENLLLMKSHSCGKTDATATNGYAWRWLTLFSHATTTTAYS